MFKTSQSIPYSIFSISTPECLSSCITGLQPLLKVSVQSNSETNPHLHDKRSTNRHSDHTIEMSEITLIDTF